MTPPKCPSCGAELPDPSAETCPNCEAGEGAKNQTIGAPVARVEVEVPDVSIWLSQTVAPEWLADARDEAERGRELEAELEGEWTEDVQTAHTRSLHREIVFAVCFAEAFLLEYLRDHVFVRGPGKGHREALRRFLDEAKDPDGRRIWGRRGMGIRDRWKETVRLLQQEGRLEEGGLEGQAWETFQKEVAPYRNGIVHASISVPTPGGEESQEPTPSTLSELGSGSGTEVVVELARELHELNPRGMDPPEYLE